MARYPGKIYVRDEIDRVGGAGVLGLAVVLVIGLAAVGIEGHVLENGSKVVGGSVDLGLRVF